ncbi:MAG TPA: guanylate kinase [Vicinamibacterales bacterium]|nr:guanylate kinase [Vicinamibacterales bacterium]
MSSSAQAGPRPRVGQLFVISAPSGTGKTTVVERLVQLVPELALSRSYTSRPARAGETNGVDYNFVTRSRFEEMIGADDFLEWADVFGNLYGTCAADSNRDLARGCDLLLVIDVQGARQVRRRCQGTVGVFFLPPSFEALEQRLRGRSKDPEDAIQRRLRTARNEVAGFLEYDYVIVNDELEACVERLKGIILAERSRLQSVRAEAARIVESFLNSTP